MFWYCPSCLKGNGPNACKSRFAKAKHPSASQTLVLLLPWRMPQGRAGSESISLLGAPKHNQQPSSSQRASLRLSQGPKLRYCEFYLVNFHSLLIFWWMSLQEDRREAWAHRGMKSKGCLWYFFPFNLLQISPSDHKCQNGFIKAKVCGRALTAKALLSLRSLWRFSSKLFPPCVSSVTKPSGNQLHMLPQVFLQLHSFVCMWW